MDKGFEANTMKNYHRLRIPSGQIRAGKRILNQWRFEHLMWYSRRVHSYKSSSRLIKPKLTKEQRKRFSIVESVDGFNYLWVLPVRVPLGIQTRMSEAEAIDAIEGLTSLQQQFRLPEAL